MSKSITRTFLTRNPDGTVTTQHIGPSHRVLAETVDLPPGASLEVETHRLLAEAKADMVVVQDSVPPSTDRA